MESACLHGYRRRSGACWVGSSRSAGGLSFDIASPWLSQVVWGMMLLLYLCLLGYAGLGGRKSAAVARTIPKPTFYFDT